MRSKLSLDFTHKYLSAAESDDDMASDTAQHKQAPTIIGSWTPAPLLREWAKATLASGEWKDALVAAASVGIFFCSGTPRGIDAVMICSSHFPELQYIGSYVNVWKRPIV